MKLKYKITLSILLVSLSILYMVSYVYSSLSYAHTIEHEKVNLLENVMDSTHHIEAKLLDKLANALTMSSAPIVYKELENSNQEYNKLSDEQRKEHIDNLNITWMSTDSIEDSFIQSYLNNKLALFLKQQQKVLPNVYGEIFITNRYGAMIASTGRLTTLKHKQKYWWKESFAEGKGKVFFDDRGFDTSVNGYVVGIVVPIKQDDKIIGILKVNINILNTLKSLIDEHEMREHGSLKIVRTKGLIVYESGEIPLSTKISKSMIEELQEKKTQTIELSDNTHKLVAHVPFSLNYYGEDLAFGGKPTTSGSIKGNEGEHWHSVIEYDKELALSGIKDTNELIIYIGLLVSFLAAVIAYIIGDRISKPIEALALTQQELIEQEKIMIAQSRHAAMGEMISMIAHQWRQPIGTIAMAVNNILADIALDTLKEDQLEHQAKDIIKKTQELSKTIDDFANFFSPSKQKELIKVNDIMEETFSLIGKSLEAHSISVEKEYASETAVLIFSRELLQVLINIVKNAKEALVENEIKDAFISVSTSEDTENIYISISNNGKNIADDIIDKLYEPYFSTKAGKNATGLGLYMSKIIMEQHLQGTIDAENKQDGGVCFKLSISKSTSEKD